MTHIRIAAERGSHFLVTDGARFAIVERRDGRFYGVGPDRRDGSSADDAGIAAAVGDDWTDEASARRALAEVGAQGDALAKGLW